MRQVYVCMARCSKYLMISGKRCTCYNPQTFTCQAKKRTRILYLRISRIDIERSGKTWVVKYMLDIEERGPMENDALCPNCGARMDGGDEDVER